MRIGECVEEEDICMYEFCCFAFALPIHILVDNVPPYAISFLAMTLIISAKSSASF
jgi:hypothetical protein